MTATKKFIEDAEKGGWKPAKEEEKRWDYMQISYGNVLIDNRVFLLDPLAWQAVGKVRGWGEETVCNWCEEADCWNMTDKETRCSRWGKCGGSKLCKIKQHQFIDHLVSGKTIDEALQAIE